MQAINPSGVMGVATQVEKAQDEGRGFQEVSDLLHAIRASIILEEEMVVFWLIAGSQVSTMVWRPGTRECF